MKSTYVIVRRLATDKKLRAAEISSTVSQENHSHDGRLFCEACGITRRQGQHERERGGNGHDQPETSETGQFLGLGQELDHENTRSSHEEGEDEGDKARLPNVGGKYGGENDSEKLKCRSREAHQDGFELIVAETLDDERVELVEQLETNPCEHQSERFCLRWWFLHWERK